LQQAGPRGGDLDNFNPGFSNEKNLVASPFSNGVRWMNPAFQFQAGEYATQHENVDMG
jgi:hypothetical protein